MSQLLKMLGAGADMADLIQYLNNNLNPSQVSKFSSDNSGNVSLVMPNGSLFPLTGTLRSITTLAASTADLAALATGSVIPFPTAIRDDLGLRDPVNLGRIWIPAGAKSIRVTAPVSFNALVAGTYRRVNPNFVVNGTLLTATPGAAGYPGIYQLGYKAATVPNISGQTASVLLMSTLIDTSTWATPSSLGASYIQLLVQHDTAGTDLVTSAGSSFSVEVYT